ncbi:MAG: PBP1A family penicillin-binding protein [Pseudomonadota bacterium]
MSDHRKRSGLVAEKRKFVSENPKAKQPKHKKVQKPQRHWTLRILFSVFRIFWWLGTRVAIVLVLFIGGWTLWDFSQLPSLQKMVDDRENGSITLLDKDGKVFAWRGDQFGGLVTAESVSPHLKNAVIAVEDKRFYYHLGVSPRGIASAVRINMREGRSALDGHGGSTITQQVAKRVFFPNMGGMERKVREVPRSLAMELKFTKDEILAIYLNRAYLGAGTFGFEAAAQRYFGKSARSLNIAESAMLAGLLKAPSRFNPTNNFDRAADRASLIIGLMAEQGYISADEAQMARANPATLSRVAREQTGGFYADWIVETAPEFLIKDSANDLIIQTTFDPNLQRAAELGLQKVFNEKVKEGSEAQAAIVIMTHDGAVRAMVGGRDTGLPGQFNRATQAFRQTGSSFKPFVYGAALESGWGGNSILDDSPFCIQIPAQPDYCPENYDREFKGLMTMTQALAESRNTVAVKVSEEVGRARVRAVANDLGVRADLSDTPSLALGVSESTLLDMTSAYAGIRNNGIAVTPFGFRQIVLQGERTPLFSQSPVEGTRVLSDRAAGELMFMMSQVVSVGTGRRARMEGWDIAGKTGTTQGLRDAWFIGFTSEYIAGVWMGYDDNSQMSGVTGGSIPADIWRETMIGVHQGLTPTPLPAILPAPRPEDVVDRNSTIEDAISRELNKVEEKVEEAVTNFFDRLFNRN